MEDQSNGTLQQGSTASPITQVTQHKSFFNTKFANNYYTPFQNMHCQQVSSPPSVPVALSSSPLPLKSSSVEPNQAQVNQGTTVSSSNLTPVTSEVPAVVSTITILPQTSSPETIEAEIKRSKVGRPRTKPQKEKTEWHQHLGGVRHCRYVPM